MKKNILSRCIVSFAFSTTITQILILIMAIIMAFFGKEPLVPVFREMFANDVIAIGVHNLGAGCIGAAFGACSVIFEIERWSFLKQGIIHFVITTAVWMPIAAVLWGLYKYPQALLSTLISMSVTYAITWITRYHSCKKSIGDINEKLKDLNENS